MEEYIRTQNGGGYSTGHQEGGYLSQQSTSTIEQHGSIGSKFLGQQGTGTIEQGSKGAEYLGTSIVEQQGSKVQYITGQEGSTIIGGGDTCVTTTETITEIIPETIVHEERIPGSHYHNVFTEGVGGQTEVTGVTKTIIKTTTVDGETITTQETYTE